MKQKRRNASRKRRQHKFDHVAIAKVSSWIERMLVNANRAVNLAGKLSSSDLHESNDLFWALAKYAENVQESITQLDNVNKRILDRLIEIPVRSEIDGDATWTGLKGMRTKLAHEFWSIDPEILWVTITEDFPKLIALLRTIRLVREPIAEGQPLRVTVKGSDLLSLPALDGHGKPIPGQSLLCLWFDEDGSPLVFRIGVKGAKKLAFWPSEPIHLEGMYRVNCEPEGKEDLTRIGPAMDIK